MYWKEDNNIIPVIANKKKRVPTINQIITTYHLKLLINIKLSEFFRSLYSF